MPFTVPFDYQLLFERLPGLFIILKPDFKVVAVSDAYLEVAKMSREKMIGRKFFDLFPDDADGGLRTSLEKVLRTRSADGMKGRKYSFQNQDGSVDVRYWNAVNSPLLSPSGEVAFIIRRVDDVTAHIEQEGEYRAVEQERDLFFSHSFDLMAVVGSDGYFKKLNPAFERTLGYKDDELLSRPLTEFLHPEDVEKTKKGIRTLSDGLPTISSINRYRCKDGKYKWFSWNTTSIGDIFYSVGRDITKQRETEETIRQLNAELETKNEDLETKIQERIAELKHSEAQILQLQKMDAVGRLAGGVAHDFNNMLGAISLYCDILLDNADKPQTVRENVQDIVAATARAAALTRQLLVFSRKQIVQPQILNLNPLIQHLQKMLSRLIGEKVKVVTKLADDLKSVSVDPSQMEQVIMNLVVNARDAMPQGGTLTVETSNVHLDEEFTSTHLSVSPGAYVMISVSDTGTGMTPETLGKIFEPFFTTKEVGKGTGLGLTTTYGIVKQSRGTIWVYSELGRGTIFKIYFPVAEGVAESDSVPARPHDKNTYETILLVEDDDYLRSGFGVMLRSRGYNVLVADGGEQALAHFQTHKGPIHLMLTDVVMPGMSGFELAQEAARQRPYMRILYMSGYTDDVFEAAELEKLKEISFIQKPFGTNALVAKVQEVLAQKAPKASNGE